MKTNHKALWLKRAIDRVTNGPFSSETSCRVVDDVDSLLERLKRGTALAARARTIIATALSLGYSDRAAIHIAVIAAPESAFNPNAMHPETLTAGYFQLHPKHWSTSGPTNSMAALKQQLTQIKHVHGDKILDDLATLYGAHFYPGLGRAYGRAKVIGIQPGTSTFGQYAFTDSLGSVFHSPIIMAVYAAACFEAYTGVALELDVPQLPAIVINTTLAGNTQKRSAGLEGSISPSTKPKFSISPNAPVATVSFLEATGTAEALSALSPSYKDVKWEYSRDTVVVEVMDDTAPLVGMDVMESYRRLMADGSILQVPNMMIAPAIDTLYHRIMSGVVDLEIIKANIYDIAFESGEIGDRMVRDRDTRRIKESDTSKKLREFFLRDDATIDFIDNFSLSEFGDVMLSLLHNQLEGSSMSGIIDQLAHHDQTFVMLKPAGGEEERFPDLWSLNWLGYSGVLFPMSLLITPAFGAGVSTNSLALGQIFVQELISWTRESISNPGEQVLISKLRPIVPPDRQIRATDRKRN